MNSFIIIFFVVVLFIFWWRKNNKNTSSNHPCLTVENYRLIHESLRADELMQLHRIILIRSKDRIRFCRLNLHGAKENGYTLFYIAPDSTDAAKINLIGLDGYGIRNKQFNRLICRLVEQIKQADK